MYNFDEFKEAVTLKEAIESARSQFFSERPELCDLSADQLKEALLETAEDVDMWLLVGLNYLHFLDQQSSRWECIFQCNRFADGFTGWAIDDDALEMLTGDLGKVVKRVYMIWNDDYDQIVYPDGRVVNVWDLEKSELYHYGDDITCC